MEEEELAHRFERASSAKRESKYVEFKEKFDPKVEGEWVELIKDFVAIANSGGGVVVIGVSNDGSASGADLEQVLALDGAAVADKLRRYVGEDFDLFELKEVTRGGVGAAAVAIGAAVVSPLVFIQPGNYTTGQGKPKTAFTRGAVYFRHGAKSEPASAADLRVFIERRIASIRSGWLGGIRKVVTSPPGTEIVAIERSRDEEGAPTRIRITTDADAPVFGRLDPDQTHPFRQKELINAVNKRLPAKVRINAYDVQATRRVFGIRPSTHPHFAHRGKFDLSPRYSEGFADWLIEQYEKDTKFFSQTRATLRELSRKQA